MTKTRYKNKRRLLNIYVKSIYLHKYAAGFISRQIKERKNHQFKPSHAREAKRHPIHMKPEMKFSVWVKKAKQFALLETYRNISARITAEQALSTLTTHSVGRNPRRISIISFFLPNQSENNQIQYCVWFSKGDPLQMVVEIGKKKGNYLRDDNCKTTCGCIVTKSVTNTNAIAATNNPVRFMYHQL
jgi:hypothetical protein